MSKTVLGVFDDVHQAERAADELHKRGFDKKEISIVARESAGGGRGRGGGREGVSITDAIGGAAGLLAGVGALAIPGIGPIVAAGPIAAALSGVVTGGIAGGLVDWGIPEESGRKYEEHVRSGKIVALVKADDDKADEASDIFRRNGAKDVESH